jgi:hypothetical protein
MHTIKFFAMKFSPFSGYCFGSSAEFVGKLDQASSVVHYTSTIILVTWRHITKSHDIHTPLHGLYLRCRILTRTQTSSSSVELPPFCCLLSQYMLEAQALFWATESVSGRTGSHSPCMVTVTAGYIHEINTYHIFGWKVRAVWRLWPNAETVKWIQDIKLHLS